MPKILPQLERTNLFDRIDFETHSETHSLKGDTYAIAKHVLPIFLCPADYLRDKRFEEEVFNSPTLVLSQADDAACQGTT